MNKVSVVIPMSGFGRRFQKAGYKDAKPLIEVDGHPIIKWVIDLFPNADEYIFICRDEHLQNTKMREILLGIKPSAKILSVSDVHRKGPVDAVYQIIGEINPNNQIVVSYCDYYSVWDFHKFIEDCRERDLDGSIACYTGFHPHMLGSDNYAYCKLDSRTGFVNRVTEKEPSDNNKFEEWVSNGTYYFKNRDILEKYFCKLISEDLHLNGEYYVSLVYNLLIRDGLRVGVYKIDKMMQWGTPYDLEVYLGWSNYFRKKSKTKNLPVHPKNTTLVLPLAGKGSRFVERGYEVPKPLIPVDGKPMIITAVDNLPHTDKKIFICSQDHIENYRIDQEIKSAYPEAKVMGIDYVTQGQAITCKLGIDKFSVEPEDPILISACDNGVLWSYEDYKELAQDQSNDVIVWSFRNNPTSVNNPNMYAWLDVDDSGRIRYVSCKKFIYDDPLKTHAIIGTMFFRKAKYFLEGLWQNIQQNITTNSEFYVDDVLNRNIQSGLKVVVFESDSYICWGTPDDLKTYEYWQDYFTKKL
jgi:NDP-sugar pyrophosphorylase family protein